MIDILIESFLKLLETFCVIFVTPQGTLEFAAATMSASSNIQQNLRRPGLQLAFAPKWAQMS